MSTNYFKLAIKDYRYLLNRGYPEKASLKLIGDRYRLSKIARNCLFRGVVEKKTAKERKSKLTHLYQIRNQPLGIDWYNILITVESYLKGLPLFIADDGIMRDSAGIHGSYRMSKVTKRAIKEIWRAILYINPSNVDVYIDSPISHSGIMARNLRGMLKDIGVKNSTVEIIQSADFPLKKYNGKVASSDSVILDSAAQIFDLSRYVIKRSFSYSPPTIENISLKLLENWK